MATPELPTTRRYIVSGRVQGVYFRESTRRLADALKLTGSAVNLADGTVEVIACGSPSSIAALHDWLHKGPALARVDGVSETDAPGTHAPTTFTTG